MPFLGQNYEGDGVRWQSSGSSPRPCFSNQNHHEYAWRKPLEVTAWFYNHAIDGTSPGPLEKEWRHPPHPGLLQRTDKELYVAETLGGGGQGWGHTGDAAVEWPFLSQFSKPMWKERRAMVGMAETGRKGRILGYIRHLWGEAGPGCM